MVKPKEKERVKEGKGRRMKMEEVGKEGMVKTEERETKGRNRRNSRKSVIWSAVLKG